MEISEDLVKELFKIANYKPGSEVSEIDVVNALHQIKNKNKSEEITFNPPENATNNVLIIDDIGIVTYQLKVMVQNLNYNVQTAKDIFSGLNLFAKTIFDIIIMDLFVSTELEGYTLLTEIKKIIAKNNLQTKIIVITASNNSENKIKCLNTGADFFIKKDIGWQNELISIVEKIKFGEGAM